MLEIAYLSFKKSKIFWGMPPDPSTGNSHLRCSTRLSQNPSYGPDMLPYDEYLLVKPGPPRNMPPPLSYTSLKEALVSICFTRELNRLSSVSLGNNIRWACMSNQKQFGCLKFLSVKHNWKIKKQTFFLFAKQKFSAT